MVSAARKDQSKLTASEWAKFIDAVDQLHGVGAKRPAYREFVTLHTDAMTTAAGMMWEVHTMPAMNMVGRNLLSWHRRYVRSFELRLQQVHADVMVPYWDWAKDRRIPAALSDPA